MTKYYYTKTDKQKLRKIFRLTGLLVAIVGFLSLIYFMFPIVSYFLFLRHTAVAASFTTPIPHTTVLNKSSLLQMVSSSSQALSGTDFTNAKTWFPSFTPDQTKPRVEKFSLSIPKLDIKDAYVSTIDYEVGRHLINYGGTAIPPEKGNSVVFGHSTLPQFFNMNDYKTIFARLHTLKIGDTIVVTAEGKDYTYRVNKITIVEPEDFSPLMQQYDSSYLTLITCTPPGTIWQRLVVKAEIVE